MGKYFLIKVIIISTLSNYKDYKLNVDKEKRTIKTEDIP